MTIIACPECTNGVSHTAISCPKCGFQLQERAPQPERVQAAPAPVKKKNKNLGCGQIVAVLFILTCAVCTIGLVTSDSKRTKAKTKTTQSASEKAAPLKAKAVKKEIVVKVSARKFFKDYQENEVMADEKYKDKTVEVLGKVQEVSKGLFDGINVSLRTSNQFMPINSSLKKEEKSTAAKLKKGRKVRLKCKGGIMVLGTPSLNECSIVEYW